jgi:hypothetical protein
LFSSENRVISLFFINEEISFEQPIFICVNH